MKKLLYLVPILAQACFGNLITNGSFESQGLPQGAPDFFTVPAGWTYVNQANSGAGMFLQDYGTFGLPANPAAGAGTTALGFGGNGVTGQSVEQTIGTSAGTGYTLSFSYVIQ